MKATDLMIGDFIKLPDGASAKVISIAQDGIYFEDSQSEGVATFDNLLPLPLTQEILFKNGWIYLGDYWDIEIDEGFMLEIGVDGKNRYWWTVGTMLICPINSVHELQHALRLCGIDKEIEL